VSGEIVHYVNWNGERVGLTMTKLRQVAPLLARELRGRYQGHKRATAAARRRWRETRADRKIQRTIEREARPAWKRLLARVRRGKA
jgi:hypothetical protein